MRLMKFSGVVVFSFYQLQFFEQGSYRCIPTPPLPKLAGADTLATFTGEGLPDGFPEMITCQIWQVWRAGGVAEYVLQ